MHLHERRLLLIVHDVGVGMDYSQVILIVGGVLDHLGILVNYLSPPSPAHGLGVVLLAEDGCNGLRENLRTHRLLDALLDAHVREIILRYNLMHLR